MAREEILQTKPSLFFLCLFPAGIQVSLITGITVKPLESWVWEGNRQVQQFLSSAHSLSVTAFCSVHSERSPTLAGCLGTKSPLCLPVPPVLLQTPGWGSPECPSVPGILSPGSTDTQTQWEPPTANSNKNMAVYSKRQTHLQRSSLSRKSDALLPSWRQLRSLLCRVTFTSIVWKNKEERERKAKRQKPPIHRASPATPLPLVG